MPDPTAADRRDWLQGYEFALRNLSDEAVQADLARVRAESDTHGSDGQSGQPRTVRESGAHKPTATAASIPYEGTDCTPEEAVEAVKRYRRALRKIVDCPNPDSVENCHDRMWGLAQEALGD